MVQMNGLPGGVRGGLLTCGHGSVGVTLRTDGPKKPTYLSLVLLSVLWCCASYLKCAVMNLFAR